MAEFIATIKVQVENLGLGGATGGAGGGASVPSQSPASSAGDARSPEEVRQAFSTLAETLRTFTLTISQVSDELGKLRPVVNEIKEKTSTGTASATPATGASREAISASRAEADATRDKAKAELEAAAATKEAAQAIKAKTEAEEAVGDATKRAAAEAAAAARDLGSVGSVLAELHKRAQQAASPPGGGRPPTPPPNASFSALSGGRLTEAGLFAEVINPIAVNKEFKEKAASLNRAFEDLFEFDERGLDQAQKEAAEKARILIRGVVNSLVKAIDQDPGAATTATNRAQSRIRDIVRGLRENEGVSTTFNTGALGERATARGIVNATAAATNILEDLGKALSSGADEIVLSPLRNAFVDVVAQIERAIAIELGRGGRAFDVVGPQGPNNLGVRAAEFIQGRGGGQELNALQTKIVGTITNIVRAGQPLDAIRAAFRLLATDTDNFEENLRKISRELRGAGQAAVGGVEGFDRLQEVLKFLKIRRDSKGNLVGNTPAVGVAESEFNAANIAKARQELVGRGVGSSSLRNLQVTDSSGNIKKIQVALTQLGDTVDSVRVRVTKLSDNMFDRASVRTALQRVAVWGAAAGVVFGAVTAFRNAVDTVVKTEASIFTLAKVMDEAQADFTGFTRKAQEAGIAIAQEFGQPLQDILDTMILFGQQGLTFPEVKNLTAASALAANVTTLDQPTAASALTAATEQFGIATTDAISIVDKFNNVANNAAVTETQLAEALKRAGSSAVNAGVSFDQFNGLVAAISEQTRQAGSEIGNALKFVFSRLNTPEAEKGLARVGVALRDAQGNVRPFADIVGELAGRFDTLSEAQRNQVAIAVAGSHRFNTFLALIKNFEEFQASTANSVNAAGSALREQEKITTTAAFKLTQLKNSASAAALSFGGIFSPVLKTTTDVAKVFLDTISGIPDIFKLIAFAAGASVVAFTKFSQQATSIIDLFDRTGSGGKGVFGSLAAGLTQGVDLENQRALNPETDILRVTRPGAVAGRAVGDFAGFAGLGGAKLFSREGLANIFSGGAKNAAEFRKSLEASNLVLVDSAGKAVSGEKSFTKFAAAVRGFGVAGKENVDEFGKATNVTALGLAALNNPLAKIAGSLIIFSNGIIKAVGAAATLGQANVVGIFDRLEGGISKINPQLATFAGGLIRIGAAAGAIVLVVKGIQLLSDVLNENGETIKAGLNSEIAKRQEVLDAIRKQRDGIAGLAKDESRAAQVNIKSLTQSSELRDEDIRLGTFKSPLLEQQRLAESQRNTFNSIGLSNPELISGFDEFGNAVLRSADAFEQLADSVDSTQKKLLALTKVQVIEGFIKDLEPASGGKAFFGGFIRGVGDLIDILPGLSGTFDDVGKTAGDKFRGALSEMEDSVGDFRSVLSRELGGVDLKLIDEDFATTFDEQSRKFQDNALEFRRVIETIRNEIRTLPEDTGELLLRSKRVVDFTDLEARRLTSETGTGVTGGQVRQQLFLQNRSSFRGGFAQNIGLSGEETLARFNESGIIQRVLNVRDNVEDALSSLQGGELIVTSLLGDDAQIEVVVNEFGQRLAKSIDETTGRIKIRPLSDIIQKNNLGTVSILDPKAFKEAIDRSLLELERVVSGAGRGSILSKDIDIGVGRTFELSGQQRASVRNEGLFADALRTQKELETAFDRFKNVSDEVENVGRATSETVVEFQKLSVKSDTINTIIRFGQEIENVGKAFEQAVDEIQSNRISDAFKAQFSGLLGAGRGTLTAGFQPAALQSELGGAARFGDAANALIEAGNALSRAEIAQGERLSGLENANRVFDIFTRDLAAASAPGGARDTNLPSQLLEASAKLTSAGLDKSTALQVAIAKEGNSIQKDQLSVLNAILDQFRSQGDTGLLGSSLAEVARTAAGQGDQSRVAERIGSLGSDIAKQFSAGNLKSIASSLGSATPENIREALLQSNSQSAVAAATNALLEATVKPNEEAGSNGLSEAAVRKFAEVQSKSSQQSELIFRTIKPFADRVFSQGGGAASISDEALRGIGNSIGDRFLEVASQADGDASDQLEEAGNRIKEGISSGNKEVLAALRSALESAITVAFKDANKTPEEDKRDAEEAKKVQQALNKAVIASERATLKLVEPMTRMVGSLNRVVASFGDLDKALSDIGSSTLTRINTTRNLGGLGSNATSGSLRGTAEAGFFVPRSESEFTGADITRRDNQDLIRSGNELQEVLGGVRQQITEVSAKEAELKQIRAEAAARGDLTTVARANDGLAALDTILNRLTSTGDRAADALNDVGQSFSNIQAANDLFAGVRDSLKSLESQLALAFDNTSIDSALGRGPFAFTRPTFEQFQQGQGGRLTAFERTNADIDFRLRAGQIGFQEAQTQRQRADFTNNEDIIATAQAQENRKFETEVQSAQQIRQQLFGFVQRGGAGADIARGLVDQLTGELESAGDIIKSSVGSRTIRNPITGQDQTVPASEILQFKGVSSLSTILDQVQSLGQQVQAEERQANAQPIIDALNSTSLETQRLLQEVVNAIKETPELKTATDESGARSALSTVTDELIGLMRGGSSDRQVAATLNQIQNVANQAVDQFGAGNVAAAARQTQVEGVDGKIASFADSLNSIKESLSGNLKDQAARLAETLGGTTEPIANLSKESAATATSFASLSESLPRVVEQLNSLATTASNIASSFGFGGGQAPQRRAAGGLIRGPGGPTEDKVRLLASPGEFVIKASTVRKLGVPALTALNAGAPIQSFAEGGFVLDEEEVRKAEEERAARIAKINESRLRAIDPDSLAQATRGKDVRFFGPTQGGAPLGIVTEGEIESRRIADVQKRLETLTQNDRIAVFNADMQKVGERSALFDDITKKGLERKKLGRGLIFRESHPGTSVVFDERGRPVLTNAPGVGVPLDGASIGVDFSSESSFKSDMDKRRSLRDAHSAAIERLTSEKASLQSQRDRRIRGDLNVIQTGKIRNAALDAVAANTDRLFRDVQKHATVLAGLAARMETSKGREGLSSFSEDVSREYIESSVALELLMEKISKLERRQVSINSPTGNSIETLFDANFGGSGFVSDSGEVSGDVFLADHPGFEKVKSGVLKDLIRAATQADKFARRSNDFLSSEQLQVFKDTVNNSDLNIAAKGALNFTGGLGRGAIKTAQGVVELPQTLTQLGGALGESLEERGVGGTLAATGKGIVGVADKASTSLANFGFAVTDGTSAERLEALSDLGEFSFEALAAAATGPKIDKLLRSTVRQAPAAFKSVGSSTVGFVRTGIPKVPSAARGLLTKGTDAFGKLGEILSRRKVPGVSPSVVDSTVDDILSKATAETAGPPGLDVPGLSGERIKFKGSKKDAESLTKAAEAAATSSSKKGLIGRGLGLFTKGFFTGPNAGLRQALTAGLGGGLDFLIPGAGTAGLALAGADLAFSGAFGLRNILRGTGASKIFGQILSGAAEAPGVFKRFFPSRGGSGGVGGAGGIGGGGGAARGAIGTEAGVPELFGPSRPSAVGGFNRSVRGGTSTANDLRKQARSFFRNERTIAKELEKLINQGTPNLSAARAPTSIAGTLDSSIGTAPSIQGLFDAQAQSVLAKRAAFGAIGEGSLSQQAKFRELARLSDRGVSAADIPGFLDGKTIAALRSRNQFGVGRIASGEITGKPFNAGRFQPRTFGDTVLDRKFKAEVEKFRRARDFSASGEIDARLSPGEIGPAPAGRDTLADIEASLPGKFIGPRRQFDRSVSLGRSLRSQIERGERVTDAANLQELADDLESIGRIAGPGRQQFLKPRVMQALGLKLGERFKLATALTDENIGFPVRDLEAHLKTLLRDKFDPLTVDPNFNPSIAGPKGPGSGFVNLAAEGENSIREFLQATNILKNETGRQAGFTVQEYLEALKRVRKVPLGKKGRSRAGRSTVPGGGGDVDRFALGGQIFGPGGPQGDGVPILASSGEFILNADAVNRIGLPTLNHMNKSGALPRFKDGGLVGADSSGTLKVEIDSDEVARKISSAISESLSTTTVSVDVQTVSDSIATALASAVQNIQLPEVRLSDTEVVARLDIPAQGIPIDTSSLTGLNLGDNLGSAVRNRLEAVEGSLTSVREDTNVILDKLENVDLTTVADLSADVDSLKSEIPSMKEDISRLSDQITAQHDIIITEVFTMINEQISNLQSGDGTGALLEKNIVRIDSDIGNLSTRVAEAIDIATRALSQALARV